MERRAENKKLLLRYLMGEISDAEQNRLEACYLSDEDLFEDLLLAEDELLDGYARDEFSEHERKRIEKHFLRSHARREKVLFIRTLMRYSASHPLCAQPESVPLKRLSWWRGLISFFDNLV